MSTRRLRKSIQLLRHTLGASSDSALSDSDLLTRFQTTRNSVAFELLMRRYERLVWKVCRMISTDEQEAEDAFQSTFLVLACNANSIHRRDSIGGWLGRVAQRSAVRLRNSSLTQRRKEAEGIDPDELAAKEEAPPVERRESIRAVNEELIALPEKYRLPVLLCDMRGLTYAQASLELGCPIGTISTRLRQARAILRSRLIARGITGSLGLLLSLSLQTSRAGPPASVLENTLLSATSVLAGHSLESATTPTVYRLTQGVLQTMFLFRIRTIAALVISLSFCIGAIGSAVYASVFQEETQSAPIAQAPHADQNPKEARQLSLEKPHLLMQENIYKELKLGKKQIDKIKAVFRKVSIAHEEDTKKAQAEAAKRNFGNAERHWNKIRVAVKKEMEVALPKILTEKQLARFLQLELHVRGLHLVLQDPKIQKRLKLTKKQSDRIKTVMNEAREAIRKMLPGPLLKAEDALAASRKVHPTAMKKALAILDEEQRKLWMDLTGEPFDFWKTLRKD